MALADIPLYGAYAARRAQNEQQPLAELHQASGAVGLMAALQKHQQAQQLREALAGTGGDVEKALEVALSTGNVDAAHQLAPLVKMAQERRATEATTQGLAAINGPAAAPGAAPAQPQELGAGQPISIAGETPPAPATAPNPVDARQQRVAFLQQMSLLPKYANNPIVQQRIQAEIDKLQATHDKGPQKRERIDGDQLIQEELGPDGKTWVKIGSGPRFAKGVAPVVNVGAGEAPAGLSKQYATDPTYKKNVDYWASFLKDGGTLPPRFAQSGAGKKMMPDILNVVPTLGTGREMLANQVDLTGQRSGARAVGTRSAAVEMAAGEAREMMPVLLATSENFKRTGYQPINKVFKAYQDNTGSVESRQFGAALNTFVNVYARAISPSGVPTVSDKDHAREVLSTADSHEQLVGLLKVLEQEMTSAQTAPRRVRDSQRAGITGTPAPAHAGAVREFATEAEAAAAGLTPGARVKIGGQTGTWR